MGQLATPRSAGVVGSTEPDYRGLCADHWESRAISVWEADCELSRTGAAGKVQRKSETAGSHHQTREFDGALFAGGGGTGHSAQSSRVAQEVRPAHDAARAQDRQGSDGAETGCGARDGITSSQKVRFARGPARNRRWCAVEHRVIEWAARSSSRRSSK